MENTYPHPVPHVQEASGHQHKWVCIAMSHNSGQHIQEPVVGVETYVEVRNNIILCRRMLRQLREKRDWKIHADTLKQLAVPPDSVSSSLRSESQLHSSTQHSVYLPELTMVQDEWYMRAEYPFWVCKSHLYEFRDLWMELERATTDKKWS